ncbi:MAG: glutamate--cysteine ligase, partial [Acetobacteraceae bacterium]|nr:glutamate--cysteine ligase [Acetobacteraceae bacterium]
IPAVMFEDGFGFERYADWVVDEVPMYFVYREGRYIDVAGCRFADFIAGRIAELAGITPTVGDFADHTTTIFTDVRLKRFLEMRGADSGRPEMMLAQSALWVGLLYDAGSLDAAWSLVRELGHAEVVALRLAVPRMGLDARWRGGSLRELGREVVALAKEGLRARRRLDAAGRDERVYLEPLEEIVAGGPTQAEAWLGRYHGPWRGDVRRIFGEGAI